MNIITAIVVLILSFGAFWGINNYKSGDEKIATTVNDSNVTEDVIKDNNTTGNEVTIDESNKGLSKTPEYIFGKSNTEVLDLSNNNLEGSLPSQIRQLQNLRVLDLSDNSFTGVPAEIGQLSKLEILDLSNNPITGLPNELANLKKLQKLDLRGTDYSTHDLEIISEGLSSGVQILTD